MDNIINLSWSSIIIFIIFQINEIKTEDFRRNGRQLDFGNDNEENTQKPQVFGQRIQTTNKPLFNQQQQQPKQFNTRLTDSSNNGKKQEKNYLSTNPGYLPPKSAERPQQINSFLNLIPPFNPDDSPSSQNQKYQTSTVFPNRYNANPQQFISSTLRTTTKPYFTTPNNLFDTISCKSGSFDKACKNNEDIPLQRYNPFKSNTNNNRQKLNNQYLPPSEQLPTNLNNQYLPPSEQSSTNLNNQYLPPKSNKPIIEDSFSLNNQYLPPDKPKEQDSIIEPAAAQNPVVIQQVIEKKENYSLERLCNDPFHSFLCTGPTKQRERITGRLRPQAKIPPGVLINGQASYQDIRTALPERTKPRKNIEDILPNPSGTNQIAVFSSTTTTQRTTQRNRNNKFNVDINSQTTSQRSYLPPFNEKLEKPKPNTYEYTSPSSNSQSFLSPNISNQKRPNIKNIAAQSVSDQRSYLPPPTQKENVNSYRSQPTSLENFYLPPFETSNDNKIDVTTTSKPTTFAFSRTKPFFQSTTRKVIASVYTTHKPTTSVNIFPEPSQNINRINIPHNKPESSNGYAYNKPFPSFNIPISTTLRPDSSNLNANRILPTSKRPGKNFSRPPKDNIEVAGAQNPESIAQLTVKDKEREHTLEELCNHPFHSFLCQTPKQRQRFNGRLRAKAKIPSGVISQEGSSIDETKRLPDSTNTDEQRLKPEGYIYPQPSDNNQFILPTTTTRRPIITIPTTTIKAKDNGYVYPQPSEDKPFVLPTRRPFTTSSTLKSPTKGKGYIYPQPSENKVFTLPTTKSYISSTTVPTTTKSTPKYDGYIYPQPSEDKPFALPTRRPFTTLSTPKYPIKDEGYIYPQPSEDKAFTLPTRQPSTVTSSPKYESYFYPQPSEEKPFRLPTTRFPFTSTPKDDRYLYPQPSEERKLKLPIATTRKPSIPSKLYSFSQSTTKKYEPEYSPASSQNINQNFSPNNGYNYRKPSEIFTFPTTTPKILTTKEIINYPQASDNRDEITGGFSANNNGYYYPKPSQEFPSPSNPSQSILIPQYNKITSTTTTTERIPKTIKNENIEPSAAQNPLTLAKLDKSKDDKHTLEEQCSHAFHSFLCNKPTNSRRQRPNGRFLNIPTSFNKLSGESSNAQLLKIKPKENQNDQSNISPEPSANQEQILPFNGYNYDKPSNSFPYPTTTTIKPIYNLINQPSINIEQKTIKPYESSYIYNKPININTFPTTTEYTTTENNIFTTTTDSSLNFGESKESSINNGYNYDKPLIPFNIPSRTINNQPNFSQTTLSPTTISETTSFNNVDNIQKLYPQPSANQNVPISTYNDQDGYNYKKPDINKQLQLPNYNKNNNNNNNYERNIFSQNSNTYQTPYNFLTSSTTILPNIDLSDINTAAALSGIQQDQFPFSFFNKASSKKPKLQDPLPPDSELIILKL